MRKTNPQQKLLKVLSILLLMFSLSVNAANIYVSNDGSNSNDGSFSTPYLTIQNALYAATAGDIIYVRGGTYAEKIWWPSSGTSGSPITLTNYDNESVILSGVDASNSTQGAFIAISSLSYIRINGIIFQDNIMEYADGIYVSGSGTDIQITNCEFDNIGWTDSKTTMPTSSNSAHAIIFVGTTSTSLSNIYIGGNSIHDCITGYSESLTITGNVENFLIENNTIYGNTNIGIDCAGHFSWTGAPDDVNYARSGIIKNNIVSDYEGPEDLDAAGGIYIDGGSWITVENNTVFNYKVGFSIGCEVANNTNTNNILRNNVVYNCSLSGLFLGSNTTSVVYNTEVYNNTFYKCGTGTYDNGQIALQNNSGSVITNNILYPTDWRYAMVQMSGTTSSSTTLSYNLLWRDNENTSSMFYNITGDENSVLQDPLFEDTDSYDLHLSSASPAIDAGDPSYTAESDVTDMDNELRVVNDRVDIGADEAGEEEEEEVDTDVNLALSGTASQSSTAYSGVASRAIDGNTSGTWSDGSVTHTNNEVNAWWQVDLDETYNIGELVIYNRTNACCMSRLTNFTVYVLNSSNTTTYSKSFTSYPNPSISIDAEGAEGKTIKIQLDDTNPLSLAEVEIYEESISSSSDDFKLSNDDTKTVASLTKTTDATNLMVYPNPSENILNYEISETSGANQLEIYSYTGQLVHTNTLENEQGYINISNLKSGLYFLKTNGNTTNVIRFVKK